jgi:hypothetical protein
VLQTPGDEREDPHARAIEPVRVVDQDDHWRRLGRRGKQVQGRHRHAKDVGLVFSADAEHSL